MKLLLRKSDDDGRLAQVPDFLKTPWDIQAVDTGDPSALADPLLTADAMITMDWHRNMPPAPKLRLLQLPGAGIDAIDLDAVPAQAAVCNVFEHEISIAEYVLAAMPQWVVAIPRLDAAFRRDDWWGSHLCGPSHEELFGRTLGIVGYGRIGRETAKRARAFGMKVIACSCNSGPGDELVDEVASMSHLNDVLSRSDFVLLSLPLAQDTRGLIGAAELFAMKRSAVVIDVSRGPLIDEKSLFEACKAHAIGGAIIDTWYLYPPVGTPHGSASRYPLHELENVIMTPHASAWTVGLRPRRNHRIAENLDRLARGERLLNVVRPSRARQPW